MVAVGAIMVAMSSGLFGRASSLYFLPLSRDFQLSRTTTSLIFGVSALQGGLQGPVTGYLIDRWGPRTMMIVGALLGGIGFLLLPLGNSFLYFLLIFVGITSVGMNLGFHYSSSALVNNWFFRHRGLAFGILSVGIAVGGAILLPIVSVILQEMGWRITAVLSGIVLLTVGIPISMLVLNNPEEIGQLPDGVPISDDSQTRTEPAVSDYSVKKAMSGLVYWVLAVAICFRISAHVGVMVHIVPIIVWKGMSESMGGIIIAAMSFSAIGTRVGMGWCGDRWGKNRLCALAMITGAVSLMILIFAPGKLLVMVFFAISFSFTDGAAGLTWAMIGDYFGRRSFATLRGVINAVVGVGALITSVIAGWIFDATQSYHLVLMGFSGLYLVTAVLFLVLKEPVGQRQITILSTEDK